MGALWVEKFPIAPHAVMALIAVVIGIVQVSAAKGTSTHRMLGYSWIFLMVCIAITALFIAEIGTWGRFSPVHLLVPFVLASLWFGVRAIKRGEIRRHRAIMTSLYVTGLLLPGIFTLLPGRVLHQVLFVGK